MSAISENLFLLLSFLDNTTYIDISEDRELNW